MKVVEFSYKLVYLYGGRYQNKGRYLTGVTVIPAQISVLWGFNFNCKVSIPTTVNSGTPDDPVAGMQVQLQWSVGNVINKNQVRFTFLTGLHQSGTHQSHFSQQTVNWFVKADGSARAM